VAVHAAAGLSRAGGELIVAAILVVALAFALAVVVARFVAFCLADLAQASEVRYLPRETWRLLILIWIPLGGILYLRYGKIR
jgi:predicted tellurium resistance membrane protein TerC